MTCIDKERAKKIVEQHQEFFKKLIDSGHSLQDYVQRIVNQSQLVALTAKCLAVGGIWWLLSSWNPNGATLFLMFVVFVQALSLTKSDFEGAASNILEAIAEKSNAEKTDKSKTAGDIADEVASDEEDLD